MLTDVFKYFNAFQWSEKLEENTAVMKVMFIIRVWASFWNDFNKNNKDLNNETDIQDPFLRINDIKNLEYILIADFSIREKVTKSLISKNWKLEKKFEEPNYRSTLLLFKKY